MPQFVQRVQCFRHSPSFLNQGLSIRVRVGLGNAFIQCGKLLLVLSKRGPQRIVRKTEVCRLDQPLHSKIWALEPSILQVPVDRALERKNRCHEGNDQKRKEQYAGVPCPAIFLQSRKCILPQQAHYPAVGVETRRRKYVSVGRHLSLQFHSRIENRVGEVDDQVQHHQQKGIDQYHS